MSAKTCASPGAVRLTFECIPIEPKAKMEHMKGEAKAKGQEATGEMKAMTEEAKDNEVRERWSGQKGRRTPRENGLKARRKS